MRSCVTDGQTDRQTDGAGYIGPAQGYGGSNKSDFLTTKVTRVEHSHVNVRFLKNFKIGHKFDFLGSF
jgi:hypothetical protein